MEVDSGGVPKQVREDRKLFDAHMGREQAKAMLNAMDRIGAAGYVSTPSTERLFDDFGLIGPFNSLSTLSRTMIVGPGFAWIVESTQRCSSLSNVDSVFALCYAAIIRTGF